MTGQAADIRWKQRFSNYRKALTQLSRAVEIVIGQQGKAEFEEDKMQYVDDLLKEGLIKRFEYTHQLAWNVMKDYEEYQGQTAIMGSRDATRLALQLNLIADAQWMKMIDNRNLTAHTYDSDTANFILEAILKNYYSLFLSFEERMTFLLDE